MDMGVEMSRSPVAVNTEPTFSRESIREATLPHLRGESQEDLGLYTRQYPPTRVNRLENEVLWDTWKEYQGKFYFDPNYRWGEYRPHPIPYGTKVLRYWDLPDGRVIGKWYWTDVK